MSTPEEHLVTLRELSNRLSIAVAWLKAEAEGGRLPHLRAGRRLMFNADAVERTLVRRAATEGAGHE